VLETLGRVAYRRRRWVLALTVVFVAVAVGWGTGVFGSLSGGGFDDPDSESTRALKQVERALGRDSADVVVLYDSPDRTVEDPAYRRAVEDSLAALPREQVTRVATYWTTQAPGLVSADRHATFAAITLNASTPDELTDAFERIEPALRTPWGQPPPGLTVALGGDAALFQDVSTQVEHDIQRAEIISLPVVLLLLVLIFGGLAAASLPLAVGGLAILGAFTVLRLITLVTEVSVFAINIVTMMGLGLAIDYALFIVTRFREELARTDDVERALVTTMATAGRTVAFSAVTVAISVASLALFPQMFLRSMAFGGTAAVAVAALAAMTVLPALLAVLGRRVDSLRLPLPWRRRPAQVQAGASAGANLAAERGAWYRLARSVMRRPVAYVAVIVPVLLLLGTPFLNVRFGTVDHRALPEHAESRIVAETLLSEFPQGGSAHVLSVVTFDRPASAPANEAALRSYAERVEQLPGVESAQISGVAGATARVDVTHGLETQSDAARDLVREVRAVAPPAGSQVLVGGATAQLVDLLDGFGRTLPWMGLFVVAVTLVLLFLAFGSVVLPVKAVIMNVLSLSATFGAVVWVFQEGHLASWLGFTPSGFVEATQPILILAIAFGLSMDYEVFLLSRVREEYDRTGENTAAVAYGLQRTGRIITSAALLLVVVFGAFSTSGIVFIKMIGVGMVIAIIVDATVVRALLVPATMRLLGRANWWAPGPLARWWSRYGLREGAQPAPAPVAPVAPRERSAV